MLSTATALWAIPPTNRTNKEHIHSGLYVLEISNISIPLFKSRERLDIPPLVLVASGWDRMFQAFQTFSKTYQSIPVLCGNYDGRQGLSSEWRITVPLFIIVMISNLLSANTVFNTIPSIIVVVLQ